MKAIWKGVILAESDTTIVVENNHYFPKERINGKYFEKSGTRTTCPWKGRASYYTLELDGTKNIHAAWYYPEVSYAAKSFKGRIAFWKGVEVTK